MRSLDEAKVEALVSELVDHLTDGANAAECDLDVNVARLFHGYRTRAERAAGAAAEAALRACGYAPRHIVTGGGSDANALELAGFPCIEPRQRHRAQPPARRGASPSPRWRACSTSRSRCSTRHAMTHAEAPPRRRSIDGRGRRPPGRRSTVERRRRAPAAPAPTPRSSARASRATRSSSTSRRATCGSAPAASTSCTSTSRAASTAAACRART